MTDKTTQRKLTPAMQAAIIRGYIRDITACRADMAEHSAGFAMAETRLAHAQAALGLARKGQY